MNKITLEKVCVLFCSALIAMALFFACDLIIGGFVYLFCWIVWDTIIALKVFRIVVLSLFIIQVVFSAIGVINNLLFMRKEN